jgi:hypothetical protein
MIVCICICVMYISNEKYIPCCFIDTGELVVDLSFCMYVLYLMILLVLNDEIAITSNKNNSTYIT